MDDLWMLILLFNALSGGLFGTVGVVIGVAVLAWSVWSLAGMVRDGRVDVIYAAQALVQRCRRRRRRPSLKALAKPAYDPELDRYETKLRAELVKEAESHPLTADVDEMVARWHEEDQRRSA